MTRALLAPLALALVALPARAADPTPAELAAAARTFFATHCVRCHGEKGTNEGGYDSAGDRDRMVARKKLVPGDPDKSLVVKRGVSGAMPPKDEKVRPTAAEVAALKAWVAAGAPGWAPPAPARKFLTLDDELRLVRADLEKFPLKVGQEPRTHYFTLTPLYNAGYSDEELDAIRLGFFKLLNSGSWQPDLVLPTPLNPEKTLYRVPAWPRLTSTLRFLRERDQNPLGAVTKPARGSTEPELELPTRADWFVATFCRADRYHGFADIPKTVQELEGRLKVDAAANIRDRKVIRAGFNQSGVSLNNRIIERHPGGHGYYWKSYDFANNRTRRNVFVTPLGPGPDAGGQTFQADGGEIIFRLPNGLQGYMLADGRGNRIDRGPLTVVSDPKHPEKVVENGMSCFSCHAAGFIDKTDRVREAAAAADTLIPAADRDAVLALYRPREEFEKALAADTADYAATLAKLGLRPDQPEPITATFRRFETDLDERQAAAELWLTPEEWAARKADGKYIGPPAFKAPGGTVKRDAFLERYPSYLKVLRKDLEPAFIQRNGMKREEAARVKAETRVVRLTAVDGVKPEERTPGGAMDYQLARVARAINDGKNIEILDLATGAVRQTPQIPNVTVVAFSPDGTRLAAAGRDTNIFIYDTATGRRTSETRLRREGPKGVVTTTWHLKFSPDGKELLALPGGKFLFINAETGQIRRTPDPDTKVTRLAFAPDGTLLVGHGGFFLKAIDRATGKASTYKNARGTARNPDQSGPETAIEFSPDGKVMCVAYRNNVFRTYDVATGDVLGTERVRFDSPTNRGAPKPFPKDLPEVDRVSGEWPDQGWLSDAEYSPTGEYLATAHANGVVTLWRPPTMAFVGAFRTSDGTSAGRSLRFSPDGKRLAVDGDGGIRIWPVADLAQALAE
jgi:WD40 repeat protein/mono/diheme cytochrome c family protein